MWSSGCLASEKLLLDVGLPDYVELVGFCQDGWDVEMTTDVLKTVFDDHVVADSYR